MKSKIILNIAFIVIVIVATYLSTIAFNNYKLGLVTSGADFSKNQTVLELYNAASKCAEAQLNLVVTAVPAENASSSPSIKIDCSK